MPLIRDRISKRGLLMGLALLAALSGCSTTDTFEQPVPVPEIEATAEFKRIFQKY